MTDIKQIVWGILSSVPLQHSASMETTRNHYEQWELVTPRFDGSRTIGSANVTAAALYCSIAGVTLSDIITQLEQQNYLRQKPIFKRQQIRAI